LCFYTQPIEVGKKETMKVVNFHEITRSLFHKPLFD
jgi:hypothetical protein